MLIDGKAPALFTVFTLLVVSVLIQPPVCASNDSLKVIVLVEDREFTDKDVANFSVHVFDKGVRVDPDGPPDVIADGQMWNQQIPVTRVATGVYNGTVDIATIGVEFGEVYIKANATLGKAGPDDTVYNEAEGFGMIVMRPNATTGFRVHTYLKAISDDYDRTGTNVTFGATWTYDGKPVDPNGQRYTIEYLRADTSGSEDQMVLQPTMISVGEYECDYTVPDVRVSGYVNFYAEGSYIGQENYDFYYLPVDFFSVVYHNMSRTANETRFELYIGDHLGAPVPGATVELDYMVDYQRSDDQPLISGRTNSTGVAVMTIEYPPESGRILLYGYINASGNSQYIYQDIVLSTGYRHNSKSGPIFEVDVTGGHEAPPPGQVMYRDCYAYNDSGVWANKTVYCFVLTGLYYPNDGDRQPTRVEEYTCTTDAQGKMTIPVTVPAWTVWELDMDFMSATGVHPGPGENGSDHDSLDGLNYSSQGTSMSFEAPSPAFCATLDIHRGELVPGAPTSVWLNASAKYLPVGEMTWDFGDSPEMADWQVLVPIWRYMSLVGAKYCGTAVLPSFLPSGLNYSIYGDVENGELGWQYDLASPVPNQTLAPPPVTPDNKHKFPSVVLDNMCFVTGLAVVLASFGAVLSLWYFRRRRLPVDT